LSFYRNAAVDGLLETANRAQQVDERHRLHREAEKLILEDVPCLPLIHEQFPVLRNPRVQGEMWHPVWLWRYEKMWLKNK
jgi:ABC-type oligopeptide transport system substrate-binding subunit